MQATNSTDASATLNGYSLTAAAPSLGPDPPSSAPLAARGSRPQAGRDGTSVGRRLLQAPTLAAPQKEGQVRFGQQQQLTWGSSTPSYAIGVQLQRLLVVLSQHAQQLLSRTKQASKSAAAKLVDYGAQHAQHMQHAQQRLSKTRQALQAPLVKLADCAAAMSQHAQQVLSEARQASKAAVAKLASWAAAVPRRQAAHLLANLAGATHRRVLASDAGDSVDVEVTVNVPSSQSGRATQARIEGPAFAPALQQSLSDAGMPTQTVPKAFCSLP